MVGGSDTHVLVPKLRDNRVSVVLSIVSGTKEMPIDLIFFPTHNSNTSDTAGHLVSKVSQQN